MAADGGSVFWVGTPLTQVGKGIAGSFKMASDGGSVIFGGEPLTQVGKKSRAQHNRRDWNDLGNVVFNDNHLTRDRRWSDRDHNNVRRVG